MEGDVGARRGQVVQRNVAHLVERFLACSVPHASEVSRQLGLAVDPDAPSGKVDEVEMVSLLGPLQIDAAMRLPRTVQPFTEADSVEQFDG